MEPTNGALRAWERGSIHKGPTATCVGNFTLKGSPIARRCPESRGKWTSPVGNPLDPQPHPKPKQPPTNPNNHPHHAPSKTPTQPNNKTTPTSTRQNKKKKKKKEKKKTKTHTPERQPHPQTQDQQPQKWEAYNPSSERREEMKKSPSKVYIPIG